MRKLINKFIIIAIGFVVLFIVIGLTRSLAVEEIQSPGTVASKNIPEVKDIRKYKEWTRVNLTSLPLNPLNAGMCRAPSPEEVIASSPHRENGKFFAVYVNETGRNAMLSELSPTFPQNSIIVKEKLQSETSTSPELLTVMIKREAGFNPNCGDWEFLVLDGNASKIQARGDLGNCRFCHQIYSKTDHVFRTYLPEAVKKQLR